MTLQQRRQSEFVFLHVNDDVVSGDHQQLVLRIERKDADAGMVCHVFDLPPAGHLMAFHVDKGTQVHDGGVALHDTLQHGAGGNALHDVGCDVAKRLAGNRLLTLDLKATPGMKHEHLLLLGTTDVVLFPELSEILDASHDAAKLCGTEAVEVGDADAHEEAMSGMKEKIGL